MAEKLREHDIAVFIVPEVATMIAAGGGMIKSIDFTNDDAVNFQVSKIKIKFLIIVSFFFL